jgi:Phosphotransferase system, galactitol-specific IIB component
MKRILVACGNGIATSTVVATKIREKCEDNGISVSVTQCKLLEVESKAEDFDLLVTTGKFTGGNVDVPVIGAISLLTGMGEEETLEEIINHLK